MLLVFVGRERHGFPFCAEWPGHFYTFFTYSYIYLEHLRPNIGKLRPNRNELIHTIRRYHVEENIIHTYRHYIRDIYGDFDRMPT